MSDEGYLLDTHVLLWWLVDSPELTAETADILEHQPHVFLSAASGWEIAIKQSIGKLSGGSDVTRRIHEAGFRELPVTLRHAAGVSALPLLHRDPFDRLLIAQANIEDLTLLTRDSQIRAYDVRVLVA